MYAPTFNGSLALKFKALSFLLFLSIGAIAQDTYSDTLNCLGGTPTFLVDLSDDADSLWVSDPTERGGSCCTPPDDKCVQFSVTLADDASGIIFYIPDGCGATPVGALFYQVDCGPLTNVGEPLCLDGSGPHVITFCKPGNNENCYSIKSIPKPHASEDITVTDGCIDSLWITGLEDASITWTSIFPGGPGEFDGLLDCIEGCDTVVVEPELGEVYPELILYTVCGTSMGGCEVDPFCDTVQVGIVPDLEVVIEPEEPSICYGETGVELTATAIGGAEPYTYLWNTGEIGDAIMVSDPGIYFVEIMDGTGCGLAYDTVEVTEYLVPITANAGADITICGSPIPDVALFGEVTGSLTGIWSGGFGVYGPDETDLNATYVPTAEELEAGFVDLILTTTDNGSCPGNMDTLTIFFPVFETELDPVVENVDCFGNATGGIDLSPVGGALPLAYEWDSGETTEDISGKEAGTYSVIVIDSNGCLDSLIAIVTEPESLEETVEIIHANCFASADGAIDVTVFGGTPGYTFDWDSGEITEDISGIVAGTYALTITDANGCILENSFDVSEPDEIDITAILTEVTCNGFEDGMIDISVVGGTPGYYYNWDTGDVTEDLAGLDAGTYSLILTDEKGCESEITLELNDPEVLTVSEEITAVLCFGDANGAIDIEVVGGTPGYIFEWETGEVSEDISELGEGTYGLNIIDANGCVLNDTFYVDQPEVIAVDVVALDILCNGDSTGSIDLSVVGGVGIYSFIWSNGEVTEDVSELIEGAYTVAITDENGCSLTITEVLTEPALLELSVEGTDISCIDYMDGAADLTVGGGIPPYVFEWETGDGVVTDEDLADLGDGIYFVLVTDDNGCEAIDSVRILEPIDYEAGPDSTVAFCELGGFINLSDYIMATTPGTWTDPLASGYFNEVTAELNLDGLSEGTYNFIFEIPRFTPCTDTLAIITVVVHPLPVISFGVDNVSGCAPLSVSFSSIGDYDGYDCKWYLGDGTVIEECGSIHHAYDYAGDFDVTLEMTSEHGCFNSFTAESYIHVEVTPEAGFTYLPDFPSVQDPEVAFTNTSINANSYVWDFGDGSPEVDSENPHHLFPEIGNIAYLVQLIAYNDFGCSDTAEQILKVEDKLIFYVPNAFTPDGDSYNNDFKPVMHTGYDVQDYHLRIYNRWGETVFESFVVEYGWDGTYGGGNLVQDGVYIWTLDFGESMSDKRHEFSGHVTILK